MNKRIIILLFLVCTSASSIFAQTVEDKKKVDIQSNSSVKAGEQILSVEPIKAELPDEINKKEIIKNELSSSPEIAPIFFRMKNFHSLLTIHCFHIQVLGLPYLLI